MNTRLHSLKVIMPLALVVMTCAGLASCGGGGGGGSRPVSGGGGDQMTIDPPRQQAQPDLVVDSPTVSDSNPAPGASFTLSVTVSNTGGAVSPSTTLRYYRSPDATITTSDTSVGTGAVGALATGISNESISLDAPSNLGTYYYGACVDAVAGESGTTNNCSSSVTVTVREPVQEVREPAPDLVVDSPTVTDGSPAAGTSFTLSATVRNTGSAASPTTTLRYYRSMDATITPSDTPVGTVAVGALAAAGTSSRSISVTAPSSPGIYYYGACVDTVAGESGTTNNCSLSVTVTVPSSRPVPNLVVVSPTASVGAPMAGTAFTLSARVINLGGAASPSTTLRYYRSTDARITPLDTSEGTAAVGALAAGGTSSRSISVTAQASPGTWYYGACVDTVTGESDTTDNCSSSVRVNVGTGPDLVVMLVVFYHRRTLHPGDDIGFAVDVRNEGDATSPPPTVKIYRSADSSLLPSEVVATWSGGGRINPNTAIITSKLGATIPTTAITNITTYHYHICVDTVAAETDTSNNCRIPYDVKVHPTP